MATYPAYFQLLLTLVPPCLMPPPHNCVQKDCLGQARSLDGGGIQKPHANYLKFPERGYIALLSPKKKSYCSLQKFVWSLAKIIAKNCKKANTDCGISHAMHTTGQTVGDRLDAGMTSDRPATAALSLSVCQDPPPKERGTQVCGRRYPPPRGVKGPVSFPLCHKGNRALLGSIQSQIEKLNE